MTAPAGDVRAVHVVVAGRVQGVGFRHSCARAARERSVCGWAANRADGSVEAVFEGNPRAVTALIGWCWEGPQWAEVEQVSVREVDPAGYVGFAIS